MLTIPIGQGISFATDDFLGVIIDFSIVSVVVFLTAKYAKKIGLK